MAAAENELKKQTTPNLRKMKSEIDGKLFDLNNLKFLPSEKVENKIKTDLNNKSMDIQKELESRKRKKSNGK